jgi:hypothetical protein
MGPMKSSPYSLSLLAELDFKFGDKKMSKQSWGLKEVATQNLKWKHPKHGMSKPTNKDLDKILEGKTKSDSKLCPLFDKVRD